MMTGPRLLGIRGHFAQHEQNAVRSMPNFLTPIQLPSPACYGKADTRSLWKIASQQWRRRTFSF
ncbi:MAG: hypothetical protein VCF25_21985 [Candidatus Poribacteria bacterium]